MVRKPVEPSGSRSAGQPLRFIAVGCAATLIHWITGTAAISLLGLPPLTANGIAWSIAAGVSFFGHQRWTFASRGAEMQRSAPRFLLVSLAGLCLNQASFAALLRWTELSYATVLALVLLLVAGVSYVASSRWAFLRLGAT
ncbi:GtrA family protein [Roseateles chitinivorans]|uniref:GtrA family protein n=1 Tax=Roseateles chitinivorans TaxID=2917965 RepID=UPI003D666557